MIPSQCDRCGKDITTAKDAVKVDYRSHGFLASEFCSDRGKPVVMFLTRLEKELMRKCSPSVPS